LIFAVLERRLLQLRETEASFCIYNNFYMYVYSSRRQNRPTAKIKTNRQTDRQTNNFTVIIDNVQRPHTRSSTSTVLFKCSKRTKHLIRFLVQIQPLYCIAEAIERNWPVDMIPVESQKRFLRIRKISLAVYFVRVMLDEANIRQVAGLQRRS